MKRKVLSISGVAVALALTTFYACHKNNQHEDVAGPGSTVAKNIAPCDGHGGSTGRGGVSWSLATLRSGCERGIGFRCGHTFYAECNDGTIVKWHSGMQAPGTFPRNMTGKYLIISKDQIKFEFQNAVPDDAVGDVVFDVEDDVTTETPEWFLYDGKHYAGLVIRAGQYTIDYNDGPFGSVILNMRLL